MLIISIALCRFDIIEFPATIRSLFDEQKASRNGIDERNSQLTLAASLQSQAMETIKAIDLALSEPVSGNIDPTTSYNRESDKIFLMS